MALAFHQVSCYFILILLQFINGQQYVGDFCTIQSTGASGQCKIITDCPAAIQAIQSQGIYPQICGFQGADSIICCAGAGPNTRPTQATSKPTPTKPPATIKPTPTRSPQTRATTRPAVLRVGDKSKAKCTEYEQYVYQYAIAGAPPTSECAIAQVPLVVGGENATAKEFPHMALVGFDNENNQKTWQCGGSLISEQFVLTAGHCLYDKQLGEPKYIRIGELVLNSNADDAEPQDFNIIEKLKHPDYRPPSQYNDIALLKMHKKALLNPYARPACLDLNPVVDRSSKLIASGWGKVGYSSDVSQNLLKVTLEHFTNAECNSSYKNNIGLRLRNGIVDKTQLCAGSHKESKDTCQGDSGGPLQVVLSRETCMYKIVGVTSFGKACGVANIPGVYTRVSSYIAWIEGVVWP